MISDSVFPTEIEQDKTEAGVFLSLKGGLSRRDLFAAAALQGLLSNPSITETHLNSEIPARAVEYADATLFRLDKISKR